MCNIVGSGTNNIEESSQDSEKVNLELNIGVFFDGTLNSKANIDERKDFEQYLRENSSSNMAITRTNYYRKNSNKNNKEEREDFEKYLKENPILQNAVVRNDIYSSNGSYNNEYTNVVRFYNCFKNDTESTEKKYISIYVEGIGAKPRKISKEEDNSNLEEKDNGVDFTKTPNKWTRNESYDKYENGDLSLNQFVDDNEGFLSCSDDTLGSALGIGIFGVKKKVESACEKIRDVINGLDLQENTEVTLNLYVFGFSRGSAAARCFSSFLKERTGKTKTRVSSNASVMGYITETVVKEKLKKENDYKSSLMADWLEKLVEEKNISLSDIKVKFLGLYDTVSSYGSYFNDDVEELSLKIDSKNVENVYQICAGDEYRKNFALTDVSSAGGEDKYIIIPGAHSDVGGGYADNIREKMVGVLFTFRGNKSRKWLRKEGWYNQGESVRTISNLYSVIPFLLMKEKIVGRDIVFDTEKFKDYKLPSSGKLKIDRIWHYPSKDLNEFYEKLKGGTYRYAIVEKGILFFKKNTIEQLEGYDDILLKKIRHDFLHLSVSRDTYLDLVVNKSNNNQNLRSVFPG